MFPDFSARLKKVDSFSLLQYCFRRTLIPLLMVSFHLLHQLLLPAVADGRVRGILPARSQIFGT